MGEPAYGPRCLDAIENGASAVDALEIAKSADPANVIRQVGVVSADGTAAATSTPAFGSAARCIADGAIKTNGIPRE